MSRNAPEQVAEKERESQTLSSFFVMAMLIAAISILFGFLGVAVLNYELIREELLERSRRDFANIVLMRQWNAHYGGVYVEKKPGVVSNPFLIHPDINTVEGKVYTKKNPALMTREMSELMVKDQGYGFHITSLNPLNPGNKPDPMEVEALQAFDRGEKERSWNENINGVEHFRYMAPLKVEKPCLACHAIQGYKEGEIRGGISFTYRIVELNDKLWHNTRLVIGLALLTIVLLVALVSLPFRKLKRQLRELRHELREQANHDALTGLLNRRMVLERLELEVTRQARNSLPLSCALLDADHFKQINDQHGHLTGDKVLREIATQLRQSVRNYDLTGRYGGEEFLVVLPGAGLEEADRVAERLRRNIESHVFSVEGKPVTVSIGVTAWRQTETVLELLGRVDSLLYQAKAGGRNCVKAGP